MIVWSCKHCCVDYYDWVDRCFYCNKKRPWGSRFMHPETMLAIAMTVVAIGFTAVIYAGLAGM